MNGNNKFSKHLYINLETFRKNGLSVKTPVWFVENGDRLYVRTLAESGKVKRIRRNHQVNIAPSKVDGEPVGDWIPAIAKEVTDDEIHQKVDQLLDQKYGLMKKLFSVVAKIQRKHYTVLELRGRE